MDFLQKLRFWIKEVYGSDKQFIEAAGLANSTFYRYMRGDTEPTKSFFETLHLLGCDLNWLLNPETDNKSPGSKKSGYRERVSEMAQIEDAAQFIKNERSKDALIKEIARLNNELVEKNEIIYKMIENSDNYFREENNSLKNSHNEMKEVLVNINRMTEKYKKTEK